MDLSIVLVMLLYPIKHGQGLGALAYGYNSAKPWYGMAKSALSDVADHCKPSITNITNNVSKVPTNGTKPRSFP